MDDWKKFFLSATYTWPEKRTYMNEADLRSLENRKHLLESLHCKPFHWYMENIYPEVPTPPIDATWYGEVTNLKTEACLHVHTDGYIGQFHIKYDCEITFTKYILFTFNLLFRNHIFLFLPSSSSEKSLSY